ncbi:MAG: prolyl oligopeptidase family serine peptidase [Cyclobacteriaceae bacterium]
MITKKKMAVLIYFSVFLSCMNLNAQDLLSPELLWQLKQMSEVKVSPDGKTILFTLSTPDLTANKSKRELYAMPLAGGEPASIYNPGKSISNASWRPDGKAIGFLMETDGEMQLWEVDIRGENPKQVSFVKGGIGDFKYAPDLRHISFTKKVKDEKQPKVSFEDLPLADAMLYDDLMYRHWDSWSDGTSKHVFVAALNDGRVSDDIVDIMEGEPFDSPLAPFGGGEQIAWSADGKSLAYVSKKLTGHDYAVSTNSDIYHYDIATKTTKNLTEGMMGYDLNPVFSPDGKWLAWLSMAQDGFESDRELLWVMDLQSGEKVGLSDALDLSINQMVWSTDAKKIYFIGGIEATYQVFEVSMKNKSWTKGNYTAKDFRKISDGWHNYTSINWTPGGIIGTKTTMQHPADIFGIDVKSAAEKRLTEVNKDLLASVKMGEVKQRWINTTDGKKMLVWVILPPDFDETKKYPTLLYCQGGPQSAISQFFSTRWNFHLMAANGYIVVAPNRRGLPTFGQEWNDAISGDWGGQPMLDYLSAIDEMAKEPYVDQDRLGAVGASYGGYSVYYLAGIHEQRFKAFISHCGLYNLESWYASTEEMFFANWDVGGPYWATPQPQSYEKFSPHKFAGKWDTPILVIHGEKDFRVPINQGIEAFNTARLQGIEAQFLVFPDENHWILKPQNSVLWHRVFFQWLDKHLK